MFNKIASDNRVYIFKKYILLLIHHCVSQQTQDRFLFCIRVLADQHHLFELSESEHNFVGAAGTIESFTTLTISEMRASIAPIHSPML